MAEGDGRAGGDLDVVVGAGLAGLACARALAQAGRRVLVLERSRGVGGRCATRRLDGQPADHGLCFVHGADPAFLALLDEVPGERLEWPVRVRGAGLPCHPDAARPGERRVAWAEGLTRLPKHLARGLDVRLGARVTALRPVEGGWALRLEGGEEVGARRVALALAVEQATPLLPEDGALAGLRVALGWFRSVPCLALVAAYPADGPAPDFDLLYPDDQRVLTLVSHDSAKRPAPRHRVLVAQASTAWSRDHLDDPGWQGLLLAELGRAVGPWAAAPTLTSGQRWRHARVLAGAGLGGPWLQGRGLGLCGEVFDPRGGAEGAWRSGVRLAALMLEEEP